MDLLLVLFNREFVLEPRRRLFYTKRVAFAAICGAMLLLGFVGLMKAGTQGAGLALFKYLSALTITAACLLGPYLAAFALVSERESRTLDLLYMSEMSSAVLVLSKLLSATIGALLTLLSVLPMFFLCVSMGGISIEQIGIAVGVLASALVLGSGLGLLSAVWVDTEVQMQRVLVFVFLVWFVLLPSVAMVVAKAMGHDAQAVGSVLSPFVSFWSIANVDDQSNYLANALWGIVFNLVTTLPLVWLTAVLLPRRLEHGVPNWVRRLTSRRPKRGLDRLSASEQEFRRPGIEGNPVLWKDLYVIYGGDVRIWVQFVVVMLVTALVAGGGYAVVAQNFGWFLPGNVLRAVSVGCMVVSGASFIMGAITRSSRAMGRERQHQTLELLVSSDLKVTEIVDGKVNAILLSVLPWVVGIVFNALAFALVTMVFFTVNVQTIGLALVVPLNAVGMVFAYIHVAMIVSMRAERQGTSMVLVGFVVWYILGNLVLLIFSAIAFPFTAGLSTVLGPVLGPILIGFQARLLLLRRFRRYVAKMRS